MLDPAAFRRLQSTLYRLQGIRCVECGWRSLGKRPVCGDCSGVNLKLVEFDGRGRIMAFTNLLKPPVDHLREGPYFVAIITLDDGPRVIAKLSDVRSRPPYVGAAVEAVFRRLYEPGKQDMICYGYKFRVICER